MFVEDPADLLGARVDVIVSIVRGRGFDPKYSNGIFCKFDFYGNPGESTMVQGTSDPEFDFRQQVRAGVSGDRLGPAAVLIRLVLAQVTFFRVDHRLLDHMKDGILHVEVWAEQSTEEQSSTAAAIKRRNQFSFTAPVRLQRRRALAHFPRPT